jgi:hypothetical protein
MTDITLDQPAVVGDEQAPIDELPRRPHRKLVTPVTAGLAAVILPAARSRRARSRARTARRSTSRAPTATR